MKTLKHKTAWRIAITSISVAILASGIGWHIASLRARDTMAQMAIAESGRILTYLEINDLTTDKAIARAKTATRTTASGLLDIARIYARNGTMVAACSTETGQHAEQFLPKRDISDFEEEGHSIIELSDGRWALYILVHLHSTDGTGNRSISGYFEGVRIIADWQHKLLKAEAIAYSLVAGLAALFCGMVIYPVVVRLIVQNQLKNREITDSQIAMLESLGRAIAKRDSETGEHNHRVALIASLLGEKLGVGGESMQSLIAGSFLHDIGKIGIPDSILLKPGKLAPEEWLTMRTHVLRGEEIVHGMGWLDGARKIVSAHHERWDGHGYPRALKGEEIPLAARIFTVADVFDALISKRPYKDPLPFDAILNTLNSEKGKQFDPKVIDAFIPLAEQLFELMASLEESDWHDLLSKKIKKYFVSDP